jgi:hypothetical protein
MSRGRRESHRFEREWKTCVARGDVADGAVGTFRVNAARTGHSPGRRCYT